MKHLPLACAAVLLASCSSDPESEPFPLRHIPDNPAFVVRTSKAYLDSVEETHFGVLRNFGKVLTDRGGSFEEVFGLAPSAIGSMTFAIYDNGLETVLIRVDSEEQVKDLSWGSPLAGEAGTRAGEYGYAYQPTKTSALLGLDKQQEWDGKTEKIIRASIAAPQGTKHTDLGQIAKLTHWHEDLVGVAALNALPAEVVEGADQYFDHLGLSQEERSALRAVKAISGSCNVGDEVNIRIVVTVDSSRIDDTEAALKRLRGKLAAMSVANTSSRWLRSAGDADIDTEDDYIEIEASFTHEELFGGNSRTEPLHPFFR